MISTKNATGLVFAFEGPERCGKSTIIQLVEQALIAEGIEVVRTREPGGTPQAEVFRDLLLNGKLEDPIIELMVVLAARRDHYQRLVIPAVAAGKVVLSDRGFHTTYAYQVVPYEQEGQILHTLFNTGLSAAVNGLDHNCYHSFNIRASNETLDARLELLAPADDIEKRGVEFHAKVRDFFSNLSAQPGVTDFTNEGDLETVVAEIVTEIKKRSEDLRVLREEQAETARQAEEQSKAQAEQPEAEATTTEEKQYTSTEVKEKLTVEFDVIHKDYVAELANWTPGDASLLGDYEQVISDCRTWLSNWADTMAAQGKDTHSETEYQQAMQSLLQYLSTSIGGWLTVRVMKLSNAGYVPTPAQATA